MQSRPWRAWAGSASKRASQSSSYRRSNLRPSRPGIPFQQLEQAIAGFSQRLSEGLGQSTSAVSLALRELGISARDAQGNVRGFADILPLVADRFAATADGVGKTQIAVALFGEEAGRRMIPLLNQGSEGIRQLPSAHASLAWCLAKTQ